MKKKENPSCNVSVIPERFNGGQMDPIRRTPKHSRDSIKTSTFVPIQTTGMSIVSV